MGSRWEPAPDDEVSVKVAGLSRELYGRVIRRDGNRVTVRVSSSRGESTMEVDVEMVKPWH